MFILDLVTNNELAAFYRRYNACCNEHRVEDLAEFVARDVAIDGTERGLDAYAAELRAVVRAFPDYRWELRRLVVDAPWIAAHFTDTGTHREAFLGVQATGRSVAVPEFAFYRVDPGQIAEVWGSAFHVHLLEQLRKRMRSAVDRSRLLALQAGGRPFEPGTAHAHRVATSLFAGRHARKNSAGMTLRG